jgi:hypothetical protein
MAGFVERTLVVSVVSVFTCACSGRSVVTPSGDREHRDEGASGSGGNSGGKAAGGRGGTMPLAGGNGGSSGAPNDFPSSGTGGGDHFCAYPPVAITLTEWQEPEPLGSPSTATARVVEGMLGDWFGVATTPWTPPYAVTMSFSEDQTYSAECLWSSNECCLAFYYGTDDASDLKRYVIEGVTLDGGGYGSIDIVFGEPENYYESGRQGVLENVELDATLARMRFDFMYDAYGPLSFDLQRKGEAPPK